MNSKEFLATRKGAGVELLLFYIIALSTLPMMVSGPVLYALAAVSLIVRKTEWKEIGFNLRDFKIKKIAIGIMLAILYHIADQFLIDPVISKFAPTGLPEIFNMKGDVPKLIIGLLLSWTTAAFPEEILFRGYLISRLTDFLGDKY